MKDERVPLKPLDRALRDLEKTYSDAAAPVQSLREAIAKRRAQGSFDERPYERELNDIMNRAAFNADDVVRLTDRLMKEKP